MLGATLYMACIDPKDDALVSGTSSCMMCKRMVINAGIAKVVIRDTVTDYRVIDVADWIENDDSLSGVFGY
jgi:dCMP deaminase